MQTIDILPRDLTITLLGNELLHRPNGRAWSGGLVSLLGRFDVSPEAARSVLTRMAAQGLLDRHRVGREVHYGLTERARQLLCEGEERILAFPEYADDPTLWTWCTYALPAGQRVERDRLRRQLSFLGFGTVRNGTWITPGDRSGELGRVLTDLDLVGPVTVFVGTPAAGTDPHDLIERAWDLDGVAAGYRSFVDHYSSQSPRDDFEALDLRTKLMHEYRSFPTIDPGLPTDLLGWAPTRQAAVELFHEIWHQLAPAAQRGFEHLCVPAKEAA
ncbi:MAG: PaaX family transcriptional regulator [Actinomycetia bacterium]|nr:PaaX family transcriptional regulator [Actinomycetes bacterium]MCP3910624.1 PaaX family transcriptional regulator [Actinomycetes bacterium]MCP4084749.1 PaaX family transcriptional regulator [Actinomycetes bacterium]